MLIARTGRTPSWRQLWRAPFEKLSRGTNNPLGGPEQLDRKKDQQKRIGNKRKRRLTCMHNVLCWNSILNYKDVEKILIKHIRRNVYLRTGHLFTNGFVRSNCFWSNLSLSAMPSNGYFLRGLKCTPFMHAKFGSFLSCMWTTSHPLL